MTDQSSGEWCRKCPDCYDRPDHHANDPCGRLHTECRYCNAARDAQEKP